MSRSSDIGPWGMVPLWVIERAEPRSVVLFALLAQKANQDHVAWPSRGWLAEKLRCSMSTVDRCVAELVRIGALHVTPRVDQAGDPTSNLYTVIFADPVASSDKVASPMQPPLVTHEERGSRTSEETVAAPVRTYLYPVEEDQPEEDPSIALAPRTRESDPIFEVLFFVDTGLQYTPENRTKVTKRELAAINAAAGEIRATGIEPEELVRAVGCWSVVMPDGTTCTANAIAKHLSRLRAAADGKVAQSRRPSDTDRALEELARYRAEQAAREERARI